MVSIAPEASIFGIFQHLNYKAWYALGEFVDNSIASWESWEKNLPGVPKPNAVRVQIEINSSGADPYIEIRDNASGIQLKDFDRAFKVASIPPDRSGLNEFGMGMKTAGFWFSNNWTVRTSFCGEDVARTMVFDLSKILNEKVSQIEPIESAASQNGHFTTVRLMQLNQHPKGRTVGKIKDHLTSMYREYIRDGVLILEYNGETLAYEEPKVLVAPAVGAGSAEPKLWKKDIDLVLETGRRVTGWAAIREVGNTSLAGFALLRKRRVILGSSDDPYRPEQIFKASNSYSYQRIFGEIHFDSTMGVTHTKDGFKWSEGEEEDFITKLKNALSEGDLNILNQAEKYRSRESKPDASTLATTLDNVRTALGASIVGSITEISPTSGDTEVTVPDSLSAVDSAVLENTSIEMSIETQTHGTWQVSIVGFYDEAVSNFFRVGTSQAQNDASGQTKTNLEVQLNLAHPFALKYLGPNFENTEFIFTFVSCLAIALALGKPVGAKSNYIIDYLNDILRFGIGA